MANAAMGAALLHAAGRQGAGAPPPGQGRPPRRRRPGRGVNISLICAIVVVAIIFLAVFAASGSSSSGQGSTPASTINREALTGTHFDNDCVIDELGWVSNVSKVEKGLQDYFNETGVQPYVYFRAYDSSLTTEDEMNEFAEEWYTEHIDNEYTFLWIYFAAEDSDNEEGYSSYVNGYQVTAVMDAEAVEIFWNYVDEYWYSDLSTDDMITRIFDSTADTIMTRTATRADNVRLALIILLIVIIVLAIILIMNTRRRHRKEENEETERILNTPLEEMAADEEKKNTYI